MSDKHYKFYVSSWHQRTPDVNCVGVVEKCVTEHDDGTVDERDEIHLYNNPKRPFWITKPHIKLTYDHKKEFETINNLDVYVCKDSELEESLARALGLPMSFRKRNLRQLCSNPYVYGADIPTETLIKQDYINKQPVGKLANFTRGAFDIESEVRGEKRINVITFIHERNIYTAALKEYCKYYDNPDDETTVHMATDRDCLKVVNDMIGFYLNQHSFNLTFKVCDTELELIKWIFEQIHKEKTNFIGIWNMGFDLPKVLERIEALGGDVEQILCHPDIPAVNRYVDWHEDKSQTLQHFTDRWNWMSIAGYSQFIDSMCLYARLRKVSGHRSSYALDDISTEELGQGKLHFGAITNHWYMQNRRFLEYIAYNINDVMVMMLMEWKNNDLRALAALCGMSIPKDFSRQTSMLRNDAFVYGKAHGHIPASASMNMYSEYDEMQLKAGGTVLPPNLATGVGTDIVDELPGKTTLAGLYANDLDFSSMYPSTVSSMNISKETALFTTIKINGRPKEEVERFFSNIIQPEINAVTIGYQFFAPLFLGGSEIHGWHGRRGALCIAESSG